MKRLLLAIIMVLAFYGQAWAPPPIIPSAGGKPFSTTAPVDTQCLVYSSATGKWEPASCAAAGGDITAVWTDDTGDVSALTAGAGDTFDATLIDSIIPFKAGVAASLPGTCTEPMVYWATDTNVLYVCTASNTWALLPNWPAPGPIGATTPAAGTFTGVTVGSNAAGGNATINATLGTEMLTWTDATWNDDDVTWTMTGTGPLTHVTGNTITVTATLTGATVVGTTYKVVITGTGGGDTATYTLGGVMGTTIPASGAISITNYITATSASASLVITPASTCTVALTLVSVKALTDGTGDLTVDGNLVVHSPAIFDGGIITRDPWVDVRYFGAVGDGTTDATAAIQAAIDSGVKAVYLPDGVYSITAINITGKNGFKLFGNGKSSRIEWAGADNVPMLLIKNSERVVVEDLWFNNTTSNIPSACIESNIEAATIPGNVDGVTKNIFSRLTLGSTTANKIRRGIYYTYTGSDQNNDQATMYEVIARNYSVAGFSIQTGFTQSTGHVFFNCQFSAGPVGVEMLGSNPGGFKWYGGTMANHSTSDFNIGTYIWPFGIDGLRSEGADRLLVVSTPAAMPVLIQNINWEASGINVDNQMIQFNGPGPLILKGNQFGGFQAVIPYVKMYNSGSFTFSKLISMGNVWYVNQAAAVSSPFILGDVTQQFVTSIGDMMTQSDQVADPLPTLIAAGTGEVEIARILQLGLDAANNSAVIVTLKGPDSSGAGNVGGPFNMRGGVGGSGAISGAVTFGLHDATNYNYLEIQPAELAGATHAITARTGGTGADNVSINLVPAGTGTVQVGGTALGDIYQPLDTALTSLAGLAFTDVSVIQANGTGFELLTCTANQVAQVNAGGTAWECSSAGAGDIIAVGSCLTGSCAQIGDGATGGGYLDFLEDSDNGTNYIRIKAKDAITSTATLLVGETFTDTKWCSYGTATGLTCNENAPAGSGDITAVGDIADGAAFTAGVPGKTLTWNNATSGTVTLQTVTGALGTVTVSLPAETGTICTTGSVCSGYQAAGSYQASNSNLTAVAGLTLADVSIIEGTGAAAAAVVSSGGNNYILGSNSDNSALEFKTPANVLSQIGAQAAGSYQTADADLTAIGNVSGSTGMTLYYNSNWLGLAASVTTNGPIYQMQSGLPAWTAYTLPTSVCSNGEILKSNGTNMTCQADSTGGSPTFDAIASGSNTTATMTVGTGASLAPTGSGTITATTATNATNTGITDDTTTNATMYPTWVTANTGNLPQKVTSTKLSFNPSTGVLTASGGLASGSADNPSIYFNETDGTDWWIGVYDTTVDVLEFRTSATPGASVGMSLNAAGDLIVTGHVTLEGVTSTGATGTGKLVFDTSPSLSSPTFTSPVISYGTNDTPATGPIFDLRRERDGNPTQDVSDDDSLGMVRWRGYKTDGYQVGASIEGFVDGTPGSSDMPSRLIFSTSADGSAAPTARLTIDSAGLSTFAGSVALGANNLTMTGSLAATGARVTAGWFTDVESTNMPTVGGTAILSSLTAPVFSTSIEAPFIILGSAATAADSGAIRLPNATNIAWEAGPDGTDTTLGVDVSENIVLTTALAGSIFQITPGNVKIGAGTQTQTLNGGDLYVSGTGEFDGMLYADGGITGDVTGTIQTAPQPNITSLGTLTGLTVGGTQSITSTNQLQFGDTGTYINQSADGVLNIATDTEVKILVNDEDLKFTKTGTNGITIGTNTGVTTITTALNLASTGTIQGKVVIDSDADGKDAAAMSAVGMYGSLFIASGNGTWILPTAVAGMSACLMDSGTSHDLILDVTTNDYIILKGTTLVQNAGITNAATATTGDFVCVVATAAGYWSTMGMSGTWVTQ